MAVRTENNSPTAQTFNRKPSMKRFKLFTYLGAILGVCLLAGQHTAAETIVSLLALIGGLGITPGFSLGACAELDAFRVATESLDQEITRSPRLGRAMFFRNMFPKDTFVQNQGTTRSTFTIKPSEPADNQALWTTVAVSGGLTTPGCDPTYEDIGVDFFERTYSPKRRDFRGPVLCREHFTFQHAIRDFIEGYVDELGQVLARTWEFGIRGDIMRLGDWFVDGTKTTGPNAAATAGRAFEGISQEQLDEVAVDAINTGVVPSGNGGYVLDGDNGPIYPLYIGMQASAQILKANSTIRDDARYASMGQGTDSDLSLWKAIGSNRVIGNFRHVTTNIPPRFNFTGGVYVPVSPFKDIADVGTDQEVLTTAYKNAPFEAAILAVPSQFTIEVVRPQTAGLNFEAANYNGEWQFITGGERICNPAVYDPRHEKGRHFAAIQYAARPKRPHDAKILVFKRCAPASGAVFCS